MSNKDIFSQLAERLARDSLILRDIRREAAVTAVAGSPNLRNDALSIQSRWAAFRSAVGVRVVDRSFGVETFVQDLVQYINVVLPALVQMVSSYGRALTRLRSAYPEVVDVPELVALGLVSLDAPTNTAAQLLSNASNACSSVFPSLQHTVDDDRDIDRALRIVDDEWFFAAATLNPDRPLRSATHLNSDLDVRSMFILNPDIATSETSGAFTQGGAAAVLNVLLGEVLTPMRAQVVVYGDDADFTVNPLVINQGGNPVAGQIAHVRVTPGGMRVATFSVTLGVGGFTLAGATFAANQRLLYQITRVGNATGAGRVRGQRGIILNDGTVARGDLIDAIGMCAPGSLDGAYKSGVASFVLQLAMAREATYATNASPLRQLLGAVADGETLAAGAAVRAIPATQWFDLDSWTSPPNNVSVDTLRVMYRAFYQYLEDLANTASIDGSLRRLMREVLSD